MNRISSNSTNDLLFTTPNQSAMCLMAARILNPSAKAIVWFECATASLAIAPNLVLLSIIVRKASIFPPNLRFLLAHFAFVLLIFSLSCLIRGVYYLTTDPCAYDFNMRSCRLFELFTSYLIVPNIYTALFSLCIERLVATLRYRQYDQKNGRPYLAGGLIGSTWLLGLLAYGIDIFSLPTDRYVPFCDSSFVPSPAGTWVGVFYLVSEWVAVGICIFLYFRTKQLASAQRINRALYDLSSRFSVDQNVQVNAVVLPWAVLHLVCHVPTLVVIVLLSLGSILPLSVETKTCLKRVTILWRLLYALLDPLVAFGLNTHLRQHLSKSWTGGVLRKLGIQLVGDRQGNNKVQDHGGAPATTAAHFDHLSKIWVRPMDAKGTTGNRPM